MGFVGVRFAFAANGYCDTQKDQNAFKPIYGGLMKEIKIETWRSDKGDTEIHHFIEGTQTYLFGFNRDVLGEDLYRRVLLMVTKKLQEGDDWP